MGIRVELDMLPVGRLPTLMDWRCQSRRWRTRIAERIAGLACVRLDLTGWIGGDCLCLDRRSSLNPDERRAPNEPGPRDRLSAAPPGSPGSGAVAADDAPDQAVARCLAIRLAAHRDAGTS